MNRIFPHLMIPLLILLSGLTGYLMLSKAVSKLHTDTARIEKMILENPEKAEACGTDHFLSFVEESNGALLSFQNALESLLLYGSIGISVISLSRELYVYKNQRKTS